MAGTTVSPSMPSGFSRWRAAILSGLLFLSVVYGVVYSLVKRSMSGPHSIFKPADQFCTETPEGEACSRPDLFAFQVSSAIMQLFMGITGFLAWHVTKRAHTGVPATPEGRLFGFLKEADRLNAGIFVFQVWDFLFSLAIPEHATAVFLTHHVLAALTAYFSLEYQYVHHYAIFFGGCSEISSIFLVVCDFNVYFPASHGSTWAVFVMVCQAMFTVTFFYYRVIWWWKVSYQLWTDAFHVLNKKKTDDYKKDQTVFIYVFLAMDAMLGLLQLYWFCFGIVPKIIEVLGDS